MSSLPSSSRLVVPCRRGASFSFARRYLSPSRPRLSFRSPFRRRFALRLVVVLSRFPSRRFRCCLIRRPLSQRAPFPFACRYSFLVSFVVQAFRPSLSPFPVSSAAQSPLLSHQPPLFASCAVSSCSSLVVSSRSPPRSSSRLLSSRPPSRPLSRLIRRSLPLCRLVRRFCLLAATRFVPFLVSFRRSTSRQSFRSQCRRLVLAPRFLDTGGGAFLPFDSERASKRGERTDSVRMMDWGRAERAKGVAMGHSCDGRRCRASRQAGRYVDAPLTYSTGGAWGVSVFSHAGGRGRFCSPVPRCFSLIVPRRT